LPDACAQRLISPTFRSVSAASMDAKGREPDEAERERLARKLAIALGLFMTAVTMVVPTRAPLVLQIKKGDSAATARAMGVMSGIAAALELVVNPVLSKLSDEHGRKPFFILAPVVDAIIHSLVSIFPQTLAVQFMDRMISGAFIFGFAAPLSASLADLYPKDPVKLGMALATAQAYSGVGCAVGPFVGAKIGGAKSFLASAVAFIVTLFYVQTQVSETLPLANRKIFKMSDINPFLFLKLFKDKTVKWLTLTNLFQSFGDYMNVYDINNLFMMKVLNYKDAQIGNFATTVGLTQIAGGKFTSRMIKAIGLSSTITFSNAVWMLGMTLMANARSTPGAFFALFVWTFGHGRAVPVDAYLLKYGQEQGMGRAEILGAVGNLRAWCKVVVPLFYSNLFSWSTSGGRNIPGSPYYAIAVLTALSQVMYQKAAVKD